MDLSSLTRPAILLACSRCSSSLAALENEWAKLSNSYAIVTKWLSVDLRRVSISTQKKQIPQTSDLSLLRGRILQEITCKLCQQKLGVLCELENGPNIFWKLGKLSFREIVTMRTVEAIFKEGALERILNPSTPKESSFSASSSRDIASAQSGALVPSGASEMEGPNASVQQQIQHQGMSIDYISSSVNNLHDTMHELKHAFTALRIELNGPNGRLSSDLENANSNFDMIATVLKELKSKSEEIEKLKLEIEALKLKNRFMEEQATKQPPSAPTGHDGDGALPEVRSPGLLQTSRKRPWPDSFPSGRTQPIADSFEDDEDDILDDIPLATLPLQSVKIPLKDPENPPAMADSMSLEQSRPASPMLRIEVDRSRHQTPATDTMREAHPDTQQQPVVKRPRLSQAADASQGNANTTEKRRPGRPRKSFSQASRPDTLQTPKPTPLSEQNGNVNASREKEPEPEPEPVNTTPSKPTSAKSQLPSRTRSTRRMRQSISSVAIRGDGNPQEQDQAQNTETRDPEVSKEGEQPQPKNAPPPQSATHNPAGNVENSQENIGSDEAREKRKAQVAARDMMAKLAIQREEAMETEEAR